LATKRPRPRRRLLQNRRCGPRPRPSESPSPYPSAASRRTRATRAIARKSRRRVLKRKSRRRRRKRARATGPASRRKAARARPAERIKARAQAVATREKTDQARAAKRRKTAGDEDDELGFEGELGDTHDDAAAKALEAKRQEAREERKKLRKKAGEDAKKLRPAVAASRPAPARLAADEQRADADAAARDLVSPFEALRRKNRDRNKKTKGRESDTLAKLAAFSSGMKTKKVEIGDVERSAPATYAGQVDSDSDSDDDGADWFAGKLKFKKHTDDLFRTGGGRALGGDGRSADDYAVIDTRDGGGLGGQPRKPERPAMYTGAYGERLEARDSKGAGRGRGDRR